MPQRGLCFVLRQAEGQIDSIIFLLQRERIVPVQVIVGRKEEKNLSKTEPGGVNLDQHFSKSQRVRRESMPVVGRRSRIETGEPRQRVEVRDQQLDEFGGPMIALVGSLG